MRNRTKRSLACILAATLPFQMACGSLSAPESAETLEAVVIDEPTGTVVHGEDGSTVTDPTVPAGKARSKLTGEWIDEELADSRPFALMIENGKDSLPHYALSRADIVYEAPVEGNTTRYMAVFQDCSGMERMGDVRSARTYYAAWAKEYDALFAHYGQSLFANPILATMDDMNALEVYLGEGAIESPALDSILFFRSSDKESPHNAYTSSDRIERTIEKYNYRTALAEGYGSHFTFASDDERVTPEGEIASAVVPGFVTGEPYFLYDADSGKYDRFSFGEAEVDGADGAYIAVDNILIQEVDYDFYTGIDEEYDAKNYLDLEYSGSGDATFITDGRALKVRWTKGGDTDPTRFFTLEGEEIVLNQGKTWICVVLSENAGRVQIYADEKEVSHSK